MTFTPCRSRRRVRAAAAMSCLVLLGSACGSDDGDDAASAAPPAEAEAEAEAGGTPTGALTGTVNLGFFPNVTHAPALVGMEQGLFADALGDGVELNSFTFNAGTEAIEALFAGAIDLTFIGPNPAINAFAQSNGEAIRIVSGTTSGGAYLVVKPEITAPEQLAGRTIATPSLGNTQDVALRAWLAEQGFETTLEGGGDVTILPQSNAASLESFVAGSIDGAWVPEPWATRLILEGRGTVLVDERDLWTETDGEYVTTHLVARTEFLEEHPDIVRAIIEGLGSAIDAIATDPEQAQADVIAQIDSITGQSPSPEVIATSFGNLTFTLDPIADSLAGSAADAEAVGLLEPVDLDGIYDLSLLNELVVARGGDPIGAL
jgi:NitT/TauT family transport system substrate-binding protein